MVVGEQIRQLDDVSYRSVFDGLYKITVSQCGRLRCFVIQMAKHRFSYFFHQAARPLGRIKQYRDD